MDLIVGLQATPYVAGSTDCWGVVEAVYRHNGIDLPDRADLDAGDGPPAMSAGYELAKQRWERVERPMDGDVAIIRAGRLAAGHCGVFCRGGILHSRESIGCVWQPMDAPNLRRRVTCFLRLRG